MSDQSAPIVLATIEGSRADAAVSGCINDETFRVERNTPTPIPLPVAEIIKRAGYPISFTDAEPYPAAEDQPSEMDGALVPDDAPADEPAPPVQGPGESADGNGTEKSGAVPVFDAAAIINGTTKEIAARLAGLTSDQLAAVHKAESAQPKPRKSVLAVIDGQRAGH